ncbi:MAG: flippase-like domain-containing protein [Burkholderiales bacterium]|nr:flippase-like domain-containing protein [Burkholderiales bacterium]
MTTSTDLSTAPPPSLWHRKLKLVAAWAFGMGLLALLLRHTPFQQVAEAFRQPTLGAWLLTLSGLLISYGLRAARLQVVMDLDAMSYAPQRWLGLRTDALRVILMHNAAINLLPMRAGELSFPWLASRELGMPVSRAVACLLWMRIQDLVVLLLLGMLIWPGLPPEWRAAGMLGAVLGWFAINWALPRIPDSPRVHRVLSKLRAALTESTHHQPMAWILTSANWCLKLSAGAFLLSAITQTSWTEAWAGALGGELAAVIPLQGPAGFGTYEMGVWAGMATHLPKASPALAHAVSAALALHICFLICAVVAGLGASLLSQFKRPTSRP